MHKITFSILALVVSAVLLASQTVGTAHATEQTAEQSQTLKVECTSGAYGQDSNCKAEGTQTQKLHQVITYTRVLGAQKIHTPVNTALPPAAMAIVLASGLTGVGAFVAYLRLR